MILYRWFSTGDNEFVQHVFVCIEPLCGDVKDSLLSSTSCGFGLRDVFVALISLGDRDNEQRNQYVWTLILKWEFMRNCFNRC